MDREETNDLGQMNSSPFNSWPKDPMFQTRACKQSAGAMKASPRMPRQARLLRLWDLLDPRVTGLTRLPRPFFPDLVPFSLLHALYPLNSPITLPTYSNKKSRSFPRFLPLSISAHSKLSLRAMDFTFHLPPRLSIHTAISSKPLL